MKASGCLNLPTKNGHFPHRTENHQNDLICKKCGALFCGVDGCGDWQESSWSKRDYEELPKGICEFCLNK